MTSTSRKRKEKTNVIEESPVVIEKETFSNESIENKSVEESPKEVEVNEESPEIKQSLLDYARLWNEEIYPKSRVSAAIGKLLIEYYNDYFGDNKKFTGCGTCLIGIQKRLYAEAKKFNLVK